MNSSTVEKRSETIVSIVGAIESHNSIAFRYTKDIAFSKMRTVQPHNLYWSHDNRKLLVDAVQVQGDSKSGIRSFKQFDTEYMQDVIILADTFEIHRQYNPKSDRYNNSIIGVLDD
jgi:hypothetical protein